MKRLLTIALVLSLIVLPSCTSDEAIYTNVVDDEPIDVNVVNTDGALITIDDNTETIVTIGLEHNKLHDGDMFTVISTVDLGNAEEYDILIRTPDTTHWAHMVWEIEHELETSIQFYTGTTYADAGAPLTSYNRNGNSTTEATTLVSYSQNVTAEGDLIALIQQGDGKKAGGSDRESNEFILKQNETYLVRITNLTVNNNLVFVKLNWYEHTNR